ncbi:MAG: PrgI family protein [Patescibacteria group bacterium]|nr:PrgI family protein [Patescibacteria group bacterium]
MQQFTVPQFIDVEDKIIGPITTRQFILLLAATIIIAIFYKFLDFSLFLILGGLTFLISVTFAFIKINGRPFHYFVLNFIQTLKRPKLRVWNKDFFVGIEKMAEEDVEAKIEHIKPKKFGTSRLAELSLIVDTRGMYEGEERGSETNIETT